MCVVAELLGTQARVQQAAYLLLTAPGGRARDASTCHVCNYAVDKGVPLIGNIIGYSGKDGDLRDKFEKYGHAFIMRTGPRSQVLCIDRPEDIASVLNSKSFMPAWPRASPTFVHFRFKVFEFFT